MHYSLDGPDKLMMVPFQESKPEQLLHNKGNTLSLFFPLAGCPNLSAPAGTPGRQFALFLF